MHWVMSQNPAYRSGLCHKNLNNIQWVVSQNPTPHVLGNFIQSIPHAVNHVKKSCSTYSKVTVIKLIIPISHVQGHFTKSYSSCIRGTFKTSLNPFHMHMHMQ